MRILNLIPVVALFCGTSALAESPAILGGQFLGPSIQPFASSKLCLDWTKERSVKVTAELYRLEGKVGYIATTSELVGLIEDDVARINSFPFHKRPSHTRDVEVAAGLLIHMKEGNLATVNLRSLRFPSLPAMVSVKKCDPTEACPEDVDGSGTVDFGDFLELRVNYGLRVSPAGTGGDIDGDGWVDFIDFLRLAAWLGISCDPYSGSD